MRVSLAMIKSGRKAAEESVAERGADTSAATFEGLMKLTIADRKGALARPGVYNTLTAADRHLVLSSLGQAPPTAAPREITETEKVIVSQIVAMPSLALAKASLADAIADEVLKPKAAAMASAKDFPANNRFTLVCWVIWCNSTQGGTRHGLC